jgi:hypothetical protein
MEFSLVLEIIRNGSTTQWSYTFAIPKFFFSIYIYILKKSINPYIYIGWHAVV